MKETFAYKSITSNIGFGSLSPHVENQNKEMMFQQLFILLFKLPKCYSSFSQMKSYYNSSLNKKILTNSCSSLLSHLLKKLAAAYFLSPQKPKSSSASWLLLLNRLEESRGVAAWRGSCGGGVDSVGFAVELTVWVSRWRGDGVGLAIEELQRDVDLVGEELTTWVSRWRGRRHESRGGGTDGVGLTVELGGGADGGCVDFDLINNE